MTKRILVIEDEAPIRNPLADALEDEGFQVLTADNGRTGLDLALSEGPDLVLLDLMLPQLDGFSVLKAMRQDRLVSPVIILSARGEEWDRIQGFEYGADDYVVKPFSIRELLLRINALLDRTRGATPGIDAAPTSVRFGSVVVDYSAYTLHNEDRRFGLSRIELDLLRTLIEHENEVLSRDRLMDLVWGSNHSSTQRTIDTHILKLRKKVEVSPEDPKHILTVRGVGYKFLR